MNGPREESYCCVSKCSISVIEHVLVFEARAATQFSKYLCDSEVTASPLKIKKETEDAIEDLISLGPGSSTVMPPSGPTWEAPSRTGGPDEDQSIRNVLIWESEDLGPIGNRFQQQTVDQDNHHGKTFHFYFSKTQSTKFKKIPITDSSRRYCCSVM